MGENRVVVRLAKPISSPIRPMYGRGGGNYASSLVARRIKAILFKTVSFADGLDTASENCLIQVLARTPSLPTERHILEYRNPSKSGHDYCYYTFAGGLENAILQVIFSTQGYECQLMKNAEGISIHSCEPLDFGLIPDDEKAVVDMVGNHWHRLQSLVAVGPFYRLLLSRLKKEEVLSQVLYGCTIRNVLALKGTSVVRISGRLF